MIDILNYVFLGSIIIFIFAIIFTSKNARNKFNLLDLISNANGSASLTRILQLTAGVTGTWVIIKITLAGTLTYDMFGIYLAAMGISEGYNKWVQSKKDSLRLQATNRDWKVCIGDTGKTRAMND